MGLMGFVGRLKEFVRLVKEDGEHAAELKIDPGSGANVVAQLLQAAGLDAQALPEDPHVVIDLGGVSVVVAVADGRSEGESGPGEIQVYSRNDAGARMARAQLFADGSAKLWNESGSLELEAGGDVVINGVRITAAGAVQAPGDVTAGSISLQGHVHSAGSLVDGESMTVSGETGGPS